MGHRGAAGHEPENTLRAFRRAVELGADMVELDVQLCGSGELVVIHDDTVDRTTDGSGAVGELSLDELRGLDAGLGEGIPTLDEVIDLLGGRIGINIELKGLGTAGPAYESMGRGVAERGWSREGFQVSSFHLEELTAMRVTSGEARTGVLFFRDRRGAMEFARVNEAYSLNPFFGAIDVGFVEEAHRLGLKVYPWTVNEPGDIRRMKALGVDGIISDYPDRL